MGCKMEEGGWKIILAMKDRKYIYPLIEIIIYLLR
jgi:hypothetical protein